MQMEHVFLKGYFAISSWKEYVNQLAWVKSDQVFRNPEEEL